MDKPRVLFVNESSILGTGFAVINRGIMERLWKKGEFELCEIGAYASQGDSRHNEVPWPTHPTIPVDPAAKEEFEKDPENQFGKQLFEKVCLEFQPTHVVLQRDPWMDEFVFDSPYRRFYSIIWMSILDSEPVSRKWVQRLKESDLVLPPTEYTQGLIDKYGDGEVKVFPEIVRPGVDTDTFYPTEDKAALRRKYGVPENAKISLMISRNQKRKLFANLIHTYGRFLKQEQDKGIDTSNNYLYLSTSYPDVGSNFPKVIIDNNLEDKVLLNYWCAECGHFQPLFFCGSFTSCPKCSGLMKFPSASGGLTREQLAECYNLADFYVQHTTNEGISLTPAEARACGLIVIAPNHTTLPEHANFLYSSGEPFYERTQDEDLIRYKPSSDDLIDKLSLVYSLDPQELKDFSIVNVDIVKSKWDHDRAAEIFYKAIKSVPPRNQYSWTDSPANFFKLPRFNGNMKNYKVVEEGFRAIGKKVGSPDFWWWVHGLENMFVQIGTEVTEVNPQTFNNWLNNRIKKNNAWEAVRVKKLSKAAPEESKKRIGVFNL